MTALLSAQKSLGGVSKDSFNTYSKYTYTSSEHLVSVARRVLIENGLVVGRRNWNFEYISTNRIESSEDAPTENEVIKVISRFFISHPESGESFDEDISFPAIIRKGTAADKAICASLSTALAYWLRDILLLPRIDDSHSMDRRNDHIHKLNQAVTKEVKNGN
jgi:hypothetical protein